MAATADTGRAGKVSALSLAGLARPFYQKLVSFALLNLAISGAILGQAIALSLVHTRVFLDGAALPDVRPVLIAFALSSLLRGLLVWQAELAALRFAVQIKKDLRSRLLAHLALLGPVYAQTQRSGELVNTLSEGVDALESYFSQFLPQLIRAALIPLGILLVVFTGDIYSGVVLLLTAPLIPLFMILIGNLAEGITQQQWRTLSRLSAFFLDVLQGLTTLKIFNRSRDQVKVLRSISRQYRETTMGVLRVAFLSALVLEMLATISTALVAVQIGVRLLSGSFDLQTAFFILFLAPEFYQPLRSLGSSFHTGTAGRAAAQRIFEILETSPMVRQAAGDLSRKPSTCRTEVNQAPEEGSPRMQPESGVQIHFDCVSFQYKTAQTQALKEVSFSLYPGQISALIGPSGSGKTTITMLLLRFLSPDTGRILVGNNPLETIDPETWRREVAWVSQTPYFFRGSVADNIRLGVPDASEEQVREAATAARALEFIEKLPNGFDTPIGEQGARLSGGQGQRIALARAFLKDAPFVILDEPTANLDPRVEEELQPVFYDLAQQRTVLLISHRLHTILPADLLLVLQDGRLVEHGSAANLRKSGGLYAGMLAESRRTL
ncbi:MAG: thiol reductant ABC exporter subunit CydD [Anaerolineales bacterium]|nr:thiol reductant ABC exporter subunit CydD [Anaerolineales bacterium]